MVFDAAEQSAQSVGQRYGRVRAHSEALIEGLTAEDMVAQAFPEASPIKWHLAHTAWFFETFLLARFAPQRPVFNPAFRNLFNSYYDSVGRNRPAQFQRGWLTRPPLAEILAYRHGVDQGVRRALADASDEILALLDLGLAHEEQHQELMLTDGLALFARNPLEPAWRQSSPEQRRPAPPLGWSDHEGGLVEIGHTGPGFAFDNEGPRHRVMLVPFRLASRPVSNGEWQDFMDDGGYARPLLWQADGWDLLQAQGWIAPDYWRKDDSGWTAMSLYGRQPVDPHAPVCHISWYEADAYARWVGARLPDEAEWEVAAPSFPSVGDVWEWTASPHRAYPGWRAPAGAFAEYNGKFMAGRMICRGGSVATPLGHSRSTYRNFWWPSARWQFTGLRLAEDA